MKKKSTKTKLASTIVSHLTGINRALLDGEKRPGFLSFLSKINNRRGTYALYDSKGRIRYAGKASDLPKRLNSHLKDRHSESWVQMSLFFVAKSANVPELEGLVVATAKPPDNKQKPKIGKDLRADLSQFLTKDSKFQIQSQIYPEKKMNRKELTIKITKNKLEKIGQIKLGKILGISQPHVSLLTSQKRITKYILDAGKKDKVLLEFEKSKNS